ncbi:hypothetical protein OG225_42865 (plasmid) [Nocardia sp. NBC_01377]|uniref:hypothetical protein n=1 Tax=Nocardia sp. NBC_01377 TaxID=2903595 RepID=UPI002F9115A4
MIAIATAALVGVGAGGCAVSSQDFGEHDLGPGLPVGASAESLPELPTPWQNLDRTAPEAVVLATARAVFDWHPENGEIGPEIAARRAGPLFTLRGAETHRPLPISRRTWQEWMDARALVSADTVISAEEHPVDTAGTWHRKLTTTLTVTTPGKLPRSMRIVSLVVAEKQAGWRVAELAHLSWT